MSALPPKADMCGALAHVRFVPIADIVFRPRPFPSAFLRTLYGPSIAMVTLTERPIPPPVLITIWSISYGFHRRNYFARDCSRHDLFWESEKRRGFADLPRLDRWASFLSALAYNLLPPLTRNERIGTACAAGEETRAAVQHQLDAHTRLAPADRDSGHDIFARCAKFSEMRLYTSLNSAPAPVLRLHRSF
jgi:hypothetical protein